MYGWREDEAGGGGNGHTVTFTGSGSSPQEGALTGDSLTWEYRRTDSGSGSWIRVADTGTSVDIFFGRGSCTWQDYDVCLTATDSQGLSARDTIKVSIQPPVC